MKDQLLLLMELQAIDTRVFEIRRSIDGLPARLAPAKQNLAKLDTMLASERDRVAETERWKREQESFIQLEDEDIKKAKTKLQAAKNAKDYAAASRELENKRKSKSDREEELLKVLEVLERIKSELASREVDVAALRTHVEAEEAKMRDELVVLEREAESRASGRDDITAKINATTLKRYDHILRKRGDAIAGVVSGVCLGCHMSLPPQLNNVLARFDSIETCPRCVRIIYRVELMTADGDGEPAADLSSDSPA